MTFSPWDRSDLEREQATKFAAIRPVDTRRARPGDTERLMRERPRVKA